MKLIVEFGSPEIKHWPVPYAGIGPHLRCWLTEPMVAPEEFLRSRRHMMHGVQLHDVQSFRTPWGKYVRDAADLQAYWRGATEQGYPQSVEVLFSGGRIVFERKDVAYLAWELVGEQWQLIDLLALEAKTIPGRLTIADIKRLEAGKQ